MKTLIRSISELRSAERCFVEDKHSKGEVAILITPILFLVVALLYLITPWDIVPEAVLGGVGFIEDVMLVVVVCIYNNPFEVLEDWIFGRGPGGVKRSSKISALDADKLQAEAKLKKVMSKPNKGVVEDTVAIPEVKAEEVLKAIQFNTSISNSINALKEGEEVVDSGGY